MKLVWVYLLDHCDHAGIWDVNFDLMKFHIGEEVSHNEITEAFEDSIQWLNDTKLYLTTFIDYQYKGALNPSNRVHASVLRILSSNTIKWVPKGLASPLLGAKDKDKEEDMVMDKDKEQDKEAIRAEILASLKRAADRPID